MDDKKSYISRAKNKRIPKHLEDVFYETIKFYPELKDTYIIVVESKFYGTQHTLRSYPPLLSLLNKRKNRIYPILININEDIPLSFNALSPRQQQGILGHEMAHIAAYTRMSSWQLIWFSVSFAFSKKFLCRMEAETDKLTIARGCGHLLLAQREYFWANAKSKDYAKYMDTIYLNPTKIKEEMAKYPHLYKDTCTTDKISYNKDVMHKHRQSTVPRLRHTCNTLFGFIIAIIEMMILVYIKRIQHKPDWYTSFKS